MCSRSIKTLMGFAEMIAKISGSRGMLKKTEVTPRASETEGNSSLPSAFEARLKAYRKRLEQSRIGPTLAGRVVLSVSYAKRGASKGSVAC
jgi:hypothetical protein